MRNIDFTPYRHSTVGFDRLFDLLERDFPSQISEGYPPFDLVQESDDRYRITLAVAGFRPEEIDVTAQQNMLVVTGRKSEDNDSRFIHRGIATRAFERRFGLADYVVVKKAEMKDGILNIELEREVPEELKPRKIAIGGGDQRRLEDADAKSRTKQLENA